MEIKVLALPEVAEVYVAFDLGGWERLSLNAAFLACVTLQTGSTLLPFSQEASEPPQPCISPFSFPSVWTLKSWRGRCRGSEAHRDGGSHSTAATPLLGGA